jgi:hypothetical protein
LRRTAALFALVALIGSLCLTGLAHENWESYADEFKSISYSLNDGTLDWGGDWTEVNDDGTVSGGDVHVASDPYCASGPCLNFYSGLVQVDSIAAQRCADTSVFSYVEISFDMKRRALLPLLEPTLKVKVSTNAGNTWSTVKQYDLTVSGGSLQHEVLTGGWVSEDFMLKFEATSLLGGEIFIDNVVVTGEPVETGTTTSTTTTTKPSTTTTTRPTTTTTVKGTTTTTVDETTTTTNPTVTTTTVPGQTTTTDGDSSTTTTTVAPGGGGGPGSNGNGGGSSSGGSVGGNGGLRDTGNGIQGNFQGSLFGDMAPMDDSITPTDVVLDYKMAVEVIETSWFWMLLLGALIAWALVKGLDRRKTPPGARALPES